jgi:putative transposase
VCSERRIIQQGFRFELDPNQAQHVLLAKSVGASRFVYNWGLEQSQRDFERVGKRPRLSDLKTRLVALKKSECPWLYEVSAHISQSALKDLNDAYVSFFKSLQGDGPKRGFPRFKRKGERDSARLYEVTLEERHIRLPMIGRVRLKETCNEHGFDGRILSATIRRRADRWFVSLAVEREREIVLPKPIEQADDVVGIDLGLKATAVIHDGNAASVVEPLQALRKNLAKLQRLDRQFARRERGSRNRQKAKLRRARLHYKISCQRNDFLHQLTASLARTKSVIVLEDLHVKGMQRNRPLALSISDAGMGELRRQLAYKSEWYGSRLVIADRFFASSKTCSACGAIKHALSLSERVFYCDTCGLSLDRDENAAINLRRYGLNALASELPEGLREVTPVETMALASAVLEEVKPSSEKQEATASGSRRPTRRSKSKDSWYGSETGSIVPLKFVPPSGRATSRPTHRCVPSCGCATSSSPRRSCSRWRRSSFTTGRRTHRSGPARRSHRVPSIRR